VIEERQAPPAAVLRAANDFAEATARANFLAQYLANGDKVAFLGRLTSLIAIAVERDPSLAPGAAVSPLSSAVSVAMRRHYPDAGNQDPVYHDAMALLLAKPLASAGERNRNEGALLQLFSVWDTKATADDLRALNKLSGATELYPQLREQIEARFKAALESLPKERATLDLLSELVAEETLTDALSRDVTGQAQAIARQSGTLERYRRFALGRARARLRLDENAGWARRCGIFFIEMSRAFFARRPRPVSPATTDP
jgi:hypothetical protein